MPKITLLAFAALATVSLTVGGCSSSSGSKPADQAPVTSASGPAGQPSSSSKKKSTANAPHTAQGGAVDVCSFMTSAQASAINHVTYGAAKGQHAQAGYDVCSYDKTGKLADPIDIQGLDVTVIALPNCYPELSKTDGPGKPVPGVGDQAFGYQIGIVVDVKGTCLEISGLTHSEFRGDYTHDIAMAKIIIPKLPH